MKFYRLFLITIILYQTVETTQASEHPEWFSGGENTSTISKTDLSPESTIVYLTRIIEKESDYNAQLNTFIKDFERQQITNLKKLYKTLYKELTKQNKLLENKIKKSKDNLQLLNEAFREYNTFLVTTLYQRTYINAVESYAELKNKEYLMKQKFKDQIKENPLKHLFRVNETTLSKESHKFKYIYKIEDLLMKIRKTLLTRTRENQILKGQYKGFKGRYDKFGDYMRKKGKYASQN
ncbi:MAG: hypothetical protein CMP11_08095 [Zetaproteobacteria bacterium]|mgnify:CR=1 FL=1|nr:hypothetical protein [Pseudobdellovibrionaceae bacterium]|tara:strand:- start:704 stop:1414 length:711 start_codon:yes stop_codon:yes gene_type:complete